MDTGVVVEMFLLSTARRVAVASNPVDAVHFGWFSCRVVSNKHLDSYTRETHARVHRPGIAERKALCKKAFYNLSTYMIV